MSSRGRVFESCSFSPAGFRLKFGFIGDTLCLFALDDVGGGVLDENILDGVASPLNSPKQVSIDCDETYWSEPCQVPNEFLFT